MVLLAFKPSPPAITKVARMKESARTISFVVFDMCNSRVRDWEVLRFGAPEERTTIIPGVPQGSMQVPDTRFGILSYAAEFPGRELDGRSWRR